jgi:hypothetical protein
MKLHERFIKEFHLTEVWMKNYNIGFKTKITGSIF